MVLGVMHGGHVALSAPLLPLIPLLSPRITSNRPVLLRAGTLTQDLSAEPKITSLAAFLGSPPNAPDPTCCMVGKLLQPPPPSDLI